MAGLPKRANLSPNQVIGRKDACGFPVEPDPQVFCLETIEMMQVESGKRNRSQPRARSERPDAPLPIKNWALDLESRQVVASNGAQQLTPMLCQLLEVFMRNPGRVLDRRFLMREVWETDYTGDTRTLEVHICWLRKKIEKDPRHPRYLKTVRGVGYHLSVSE